MLCAISSLAEVTIMYVCVELSAVANGLLCGMLVTVTYSVLAILVEHKCEMSP